MTKFIDEKQVSKLTGLAVQTLRNWRGQGRGFPYAKISRSIRYDIDDVLKYIEARKITPGDLK
jgi:predicted DNA-binding transcriptional regulator AlpA